MKMIWTRVKRIFSVDDNVIKVTNISNTSLKSECNKSFDVAIKIIDSFIVNLYKNMNEVDRFMKVFCVCKDKSLICSHF